MGSVADLDCVRAWKDTISDIKVADCPIVRMAGTGCMFCGTQLKTLAQ